MAVIATATAGLLLVPLVEGHAPALFRLVQDNRRHLTAQGDYGDLVALSPEAMARDLREATEPNLRFGIVFENVLIGRIDLVPVDPPRYGLGYWLGASWTGQGHATACVKALLDFADTALRASDVFAGVTHGNGRSIAVLERAGFSVVATFDTYTRFQRRLGSARPQ